MDARFTSDRGAPITEDQSGPDNKRSNDRLRVSLMGQLRWGTNRWGSVMLEDLSTGGFKAQWRPMCAVGTPILVKIAGLSPLTAVLRWKDDDYIGCEFEAPLYGPVVDHIVRISGG